MIVLFFKVVVRKLYGFIGGCLQLDFSGRRISMKVDSKCLEFQKQVRPFFVGEVLKYKWTTCRRFCGCLFHVATRNMLVLVVVWLVRYCDCFLICRLCKSSVLSQRVRVSIYYCGNLVKRYRDVIQPSLILSL